LQLPALLILLLMLFWFSFYLFIKWHWEKSSLNLIHYSEWAVESLGNMFIQVREKWVLTTIISLTILGALGGFFLPGIYGQFEDYTTLNQALELNGIGDYKKARNLLVNYGVIEAPGYYNELGVASMGTRQYRKAESSLRKAIRLEPNYATAHLNLARLFEIQGKMDDAMFEYSRARHVSADTRLTKETLFRPKTDIWNLMGIRVILSIGLSLLGYYLVRLAIRYQKHRRVKKYENQLADSLVMASNGLKAGFSFIQTLEMVKSEMLPPLSQEFQLVLREHRLGYTLDEALERLTERIPTIDNRIFVNSVLILQKTGGNLTEIFESLSHTIKERERIRKKIRTLTAEGEAQAAILCILPLALALFLSRFQPEAFQLLYSTNIGWIIIVLMAILEITGIIWMVKLIRVKI
jgi:tight adherence protein B